MTWFPKIFLTSGKRRGRGSDPGDIPGTYSKLTEGARFLRDQGCCETADVLWYRSGKNTRACLRPRVRVEKKLNVADQTPNPGSRNLQVSMRGTKLGSAVTRCRDSSSLNDVTIQDPPAAAFGNLQKTFVPNRCNPLIYGRPIT